VISLYEGDALATLRALPDQSAQCAVTSPPFYGLRSYDMARWIGGAEGCGHVKDPHRTMLMGNPEFARPYRAGCKMAGYYYDTVCEKCGAVRERELGHEETVGEFGQKFGRHLSRDAPSVGRRRSFLAQYQRQLRTEEPLSGSPAAHRFSAGGRLVCP